MPIVPLDQIRPEISKATPVSRERLALFQQARYVQPQQQRATVERELLELDKQGRLTVTACLNEAEPFATYAREVLMHFQAGKPKTGQGPFRMRQFTVKNIGTKNIWVCVDRRPIGGENGDPNAVRHARQFAPWQPGEELQVPVEMAVSLLFKHGWFVRPYVKARQRLTYRTLAEMVDGLPIGWNGEPTVDGLPDPRIVAKVDAEAEAEAEKAAKRGKNKPAEAEV